MKNSNLKSLMAQKLAQSSKKNPSEVTILNKDELTYAMGGQGEGPCPMLTSCGTYSVCGLKVKVGHSDEPEQV